MPKTVAELRKKARLCRRAANIPSDGGKQEDRILLSRADQLEHEAATIDRLAGALEEVQAAD